MSDPVHPSAVHRSRVEWVDTDAAGIYHNTTVVRYAEAAEAALMREHGAGHPGIRKVWVDGGYRQHLVEHAATLGIDMEITARKPGTRGFTPISKRWAVERTYGWLMLHRRLARDYETLPARSEAMVHLAMTDLMARRLTDETTISWRDPTSRDEVRITG
nr:transposase [Kutzneria buriramensis]WKX14273.1 transposase [Kutzneria buriramensis]